MVIWISKPKHTSQRFSLLIFYSKHCVGRCEVYTLYLLFLTFYLFKRKNLMSKNLNPPLFMWSVWHVSPCFSSWDESSSISSGLSDGSDNLSSEEFNTSPTLNSLPTTPIGSRRNSAIVVGAHVTSLTHCIRGQLWSRDFIQTFKLTDYFTQW